MATMNTLESKNSKNEAKMHFYMVLGSAWHIQTPLKNDLVKFLWAGH